MEIAISSRFKANSHYAQVLESMMYKLRLVAEKMQTIVTSEAQ